MRKVLIALTFIMGLSLSQSCKAVALSLPQNNEASIQVDEGTTISATTGPVVTPEKKGFFGRLLDNFKSDMIYKVLGIIGGILAGKGFIAKIKYWLGYGIIITEKLEDVIGAAHDGMVTLNNALQENGKLKENSLEELKASGKSITVKFGDFTAHLKPNK